MYNLHNIVYDCVLNKRIRAAILQDFRKEANALRKLPGWQPAIKVISDVDDTLVSSGGRWPAGCDKRIPGTKFTPAHWGSLQQ